MWTVVKSPFIISFVLAAFAFLSNAQQPQKLGITMWTDADSLVTVLSFFSEQLCPNLDTIDWDQTDIDFNFGVKAEKNPSGVLQCPLSGTDCYFNLICLCVKKHCENTAQLFNFYCCLINTPGSSIDTCITQAGINTSTFQVNECVNSPATPTELIGGWDKVKFDFPPYLRLPVFLVNGVYNGDADVKLKDHFFTELCALYPPGQVGKYCPETTPK